MTPLHHSVPKAAGRPPHIEEQIREVERALMLDPDPEYREELTRRYLDLTEPETEIDF